MPILGVVSGVTYLSVATDAQPMASIGGCPSTAFPLPAEPLVIFLFNPFPESGMRRLMANLEQSLRLHPRPAYVLYHNPLLEYALNEDAALRKIAGAPQYCLFSNQE